MSKELLEYIEIKDIIDHYIADKVLYEFNIIEKDPKINIDELNKRIALGIENRFRAGVIFYSSGYLLESKVFDSIATKHNLTERQRKLYADEFDPKSFLDNIEISSENYYRVAGIIEEGFVNGYNDYTSSPTQETIQQYLANDGILEISALAHESQVQILVLLLTINS